MQQISYCSSAVRVVCVACCCFVFRPATSWHVIELCIQVCHCLCCVTALHATLQTKCLCHPGLHVVLADSCQGTLHKPCYLAVSSHITHKHLSCRAGSCEECIQVCHCLCCVTALHATAMLMWLCCVHCLCLHSGLLLLPRLAVSGWGKVGAGVSGTVE